MKIVGTKENREKRENKEKVDFIYDFLCELNPDAKTELHYNSNYQLLIAVVLSAQCTDKRVNMITPVLFKIAPTPFEMVKLSVEQIAEIIKSCSFFNNKSKAILELSHDLIDKFDGQVPSSMEQLTTLSGVGRKTANVVLSVCFGQNAIAVDTHVLRVSKRLGLCDERDNPDKCEMKLMAAFDEKQQSDVHHKMILFGRYFCKAKNPECDKCKLQKFCKYYNIVSIEKKEL